MAAQGFPALRQEPTALRTETGALVRSMRERAEQALDARVAAKTLEDLGLRPSSETSSMAPMAKAFGDVMSGVATGYKGLADVQQTLMQQILSGSTGKQQGGMEQILLVLILKMMDGQGSGSGENVWRDRYLDRLTDEVEDLKARGGPSPVDNQMYNLTQQMAAQAFARAADPLGSLKDLAKSKESLRDVLGLVGGDGGGQYSEGALRLRALERDERAMEYAHMDHVGELTYKRDMLQQGVPIWISAAGDALKNALQTFGLVPVYQGQASQPGQQPGQRQFSDRASGRAPQEA